MTHSFRPFLLLFFPLFATAAVAQKETPIDPAKSTITWHASKVTGTHDGNVSIRSGSVMLNDGELEAAEVIMDMTTITVTDITSEASKAKLVAHLKSADFFDAENHNTARFKSTSIKRSPTEKNVYEVTGDLTIKGITKPVTFNCTFMKEGDIYHGVGTLVFDRTQYDIKYRSGAFFPDIGDKMIYDEVRLDLDIRTR